MYFGICIDIRACVDIGAAIFIILDIRTAAYFLSRAQDLVQLFLESDRLLFADIRELGLIDPPQKEDACGRPQYYHNVGY